MEKFRRVSWSNSLKAHENLISFSLFSEKQRAQKVFKAQLPLDLAGAKNKLSGFGMQLLEGWKEFANKVWLMNLIFNFFEGIDPNPDNMVCAGIIHTQSHQVGCLLRLEPNKQAQVSFTWVTKVEEN